MDGLTRKSVSHLDTKGRERILVVCFCRKEVEGRLDESIKRLFCWKVCGIAGYTRPVERCRINGIVAWVAFHKSKCRAYVILDLAKFFLVAAPCQYVEVSTDGGQSL